MMLLVEQAGQGRAGRAGQAGQGREDGCYMGKSGLPGSGVNKIK